MGGTVLDRARTGDRQALGELWRSFQPQVLRYLRGVRVSSPEDVASRVWIDVANSLRRFVGDEQAFRGWLFTIVRRRALDDVRHRQRHPEQSTEDVPERGREAEVGGLDAALELVAMLPRDQAEVVLLRVVVGLDVAEVAELLGLQPGTVRVKTHRALNRMREQLSSTSEEAVTDEPTPAISTS